MEEKILLGRATDLVKYCEGELVYITKHSWDCDWYWGMGYIGNKNCHTHFNNTFLENGMIFKSAKECFSSTKITDKEWWIIKDLFKQAYALKECAEVYQYGGHCTTTEETKVIKSLDVAKMLNQDLKIVLDTVWELLEKISKRH